MGGFPYSVWFTNARLTFERHPIPAIGLRQSRALRTPITPPPITSHVELTLNRINNTKETSAIRIVRGPVNEARPNCQVTAAIKPSEATLTPSSKPLTHADFLIRGISGLEMATKMKEGRKMPRVARSDPGIPPRT